MDITKTSVSIVLAGQFPPDKFHPEKLAESKAITRKAADTAVFTMLVPGQTLQYKIAWAEVLAMPGRFQVLSLEAPHIRICDLVLKVLRDIAPESRVSQFGINVDCHFSTESADARNALGRRLAPPESWGAWGQRIISTMDGIERGTPLQGGMMNLQMRLPFEMGGVFGWRDVTIGPSLEASVHHGILLRTNHHHQTTKPETLDETEPQTISERATVKLLDVLSSEFERSIDEALTIFDGVIGK